jgi:hypothetical protein
MSYSGTHHDLSEFPDATLSKNDFWEHRSIVELHGQWYPMQKLRLILSAPYVYNAEGMSEKGATAMSHHHHGEAGQEKPIQGMGDPILIAHYQLFNKTEMDSTVFAQRLFAGGGVKFPLGNYKLGSAADPLERIHQPGTGSWDFIASASYLAKINRTGFNVNASYLFTTLNSESFQFGNRFNADAVVYYQIQALKCIIFPSIGTFVEQGNKDWNDNYYISNSGGTLVYAHAGVDFYIKKISISAAFQLPVSQTLNAPQPEMNYKIITGIAVAIN